METSSAEQTKKYYDAMRNGASDARNGEDPKPPEGDPIEKKGYQEGYDEVKSKKH